VLIAGNFFRKNLIFYESLCKIAAWGGNFLLYVVKNCSTKKSFNHEKKPNQSRFYVVLGFTFGDCL